VTVFDRNPLRRSYFDGSGIDVSDGLSCLGEFDVLVESTGDPEVLDALMRQSTSGATILLLGLPYAHKQFTVESIVAYDKTVVSSVGSTSQDFEEAIQLLPKLDMNAYLQCILPLDRFREAWEAFRQPRHLKVMLEVDPQLT
jgi:threonine dehydrogenase-like Zn-dependent dehydrogenase